MEQAHIQLPQTPGFEQAFQQAWKLAVELLRKSNDIGQLCRECGATVASAGERRSLLLDYFGQPLNINIEDGNICPVSGPSVPPRDRLLILHYLINCQRARSGGKPITFQELPDGMLYYPTFLKRTVKPLLQVFSGQPQLLLEAAEKLGGEAGAAGDVSLLFRPLPLVPISIVIWFGDAELPSEGNILFDSSITALLPTEDVTVLSEILVRRLINQSTV